MDIAITKNPDCISHSPWNHCLNPVLLDIYIFHYMLHYMPIIFVGSPTQHSGFFGARNVVRCWMPPRFASPSRSFSLAWSSARNRERNARDGWRDLSRGFVFEKSWANMAFLVFLSHSSCSMEFFVFFLMVLMSLYWIAFNGCLRSFLLVLNGLVLAFKATRWSISKKYKDRRMHQLFRKNIKI